MSTRDATRSTEQVVVLTGLGFSPGIVGGKGSALDRLIGSSIPVPTSGVVTTSAYRAFVDVPVLHELIGRIRAGDVVSTEHVDAAFRRVSFSDDLREQILATARRVGGGGRLAIRSSATVEDLAGSSFAGQYRSLLDVDPDEPDAVLDAVRLVFASLWHPAPCAYRKAFGIDDDDVEMAVVMMRMVAAETAGVVFTRDPGGGALDARIEAVEGLGDTLVGGERTPRAWIVRRNLKGFDGPQEIATALRLSLEIERLEGSPQDVEWAYDGAKVWIVQARPITVAGEIVRRRIRRPRRCRRAHDRGHRRDAPGRLSSAALADRLPSVQRGILETRRGLGGRIGSPRRRSQVRPPRPRSRCDGLRRAS